MHLSGSGPDVFYLRLLILRGSGMSKDMTDAFEEGITAYPDYYRLYEILLDALQPKWGGTMEAMYAFADRYASHAPEYSPIRLLYLDLFRDLLNAASIACTDGQRNGAQMSQCVKSELVRTIRPGLNESVLSALRLYDHSDSYQFGAAIDQILFDMLETAGGDAYSGAMLQLVADAMHSDTQLKEERPGRNNYIIDKAVSISWYVKGFYDNALKKDQEALRDIETTTFPSEEARDLAIADIYDYMAGTYNKLGKYLEMIVYQKAAVSLSGSSEGKHLICYGYYKLGDYEGSIQVCTDSLDTETDGLQARYWRGAAYRELGQFDAALRDFTIVADSEDSFRAGAAIDISMIYFNRNDVKGALNVLNKYAYLYDPRTTSGSNVAVSYNNRCYAYMRLGELKLALDDCTASLRYGSLPDALRKQQELLKQLGT
jgi:tetratricopeptide (TPR) repeat protein